MTYPQHHGPWRILGRTPIYRDPWIDVVRDEVIRPDGESGSHCVVRLKRGVTVLAVDDDGTTYLTEEFHYAVGRTTLEAVSGGIDEGEDAERSVRRELEEELGITADRWTDLGECDPFTSVVVSPTRLFLARGLTFGRTSPEGTEQIACRSMPFEQAVQMVLDGGITHGPSCVVILKASYLMQGQERS
jgi:ADP-ribose pyrophosphatase